jgi:hypothetical protein
MIFCLGLSFCSNRGWEQASYVYNMGAQPLPNFNEDYKTIILVGGSSHFSL